jgi:hypothetical protein
MHQHEVLQTTKDTSSMWNDGTPVVTSSHLTVQFKGTVLMEF